MAKPRRKAPGIQYRGAFQYRWQVRRSGYAASGVETTLEAAAAQRALVIDQIRRGVFVPKIEVANRPRTLSDAIRRWADETVGLRRTEDAQEKHRQRAARVIALVQEIRPSLDRELNRIKKPDMIAYREWRRAHGVSASTIANEMFAVSQTYRTAIENWGLELVNPCSGRDGQGNPVVPSARAERGTRPLRNARPITEAELRRLIAEAARYRHMQNVLTLAVLTGLRAGQISALRQEWVSTSTKVLEMPDLGGQGPRRSKNFHGQRIPLSDEALRLLESLPVGDDGRYFDLAPHAASVLVAKLKIATGISGVSLHSARHTFNVALSAAGATPEDRAVALGQSSVETNLRHYTHVDMARLRQALNR